MKGAGRSVYLDLSDCMLHALEQNTGYIYSAWPAPGNMDRTLCMTRATATPHTRDLFVKMTQAIIPDVCYDFRRQGSKLKVLQNNNETAPPYVHKRKERDRSGRGLAVSAPHGNGSAETLKLKGSGYIYIVSFSAGWEVKRGTHVKRRQA